MLNFEIVDDPVLNRSRDGGVATLDPAGRPSWRSVGRRR
jgi:hypothetical protein